MIENTSFDRGQQLNVLTRMLREVYGLTGIVKESPPRAALKRFGGFLEANNDASSVVCKIVCPPFVSYSMIVDEHAPVSIPERHEHEMSTPLPVEDADNLEEPQPPGQESDWHCCCAAAPAWPPWPTLSGSACGPPWPRHGR